ncbi:homoserine kinase [Phycicoccus badiiscoriae]|uniref:Homoserine kinase n=1 Tax=Pedococcus badiiscoriae TaxID=642776 RepID=A0A852WF33_9MICO|nr:homoserine kinase [Pedococcus badiiscoriae]NYG06051.1 homoserine kinase [Pedococcus badiiscoriae]
MGELLAGSSVQVRVPASSANLGPGFDSVGLALGLWDSCVATVTERPGVRIDVEGEGAHDVPRDASHLVVRAMLRAWEELGVEPAPGLHLECRNAVPHGRGLGSSATAIVTGVVAAQALHDVCRGVTGSPDLAFTNDLAARLEGHPDNSSASVYGGLTLSWSDSPAEGTRTLRLTPHPDVRAVVLVPAAQLSTAKARSVLPTHIRHGDAALNSARAALLVQAVTSHPAYLLAATRDWLHQEARRDSFPASMALVDSLRSRGHAAVISGAGPSVLVLSTRDHVPAVTSLVQAQAADAWQVLDPGVPATGAQVRALRRGGDVLDALD